jgi:four helix bundle protein
MKERRGMWEVGCGETTRRKGLPEPRIGYQQRAGVPRIQSVYAYQSLDAWKRAHAAARLALVACEANGGPKSYALFDQIRRASISVPANIVEGFALASPLQYRRHLRIALGSAAEAEYLIRLAGEVGYLPKDTVAEIELLLGGAMRALHGLIRRPVRRGPIP